MLRIPILAGLAFLATGCSLLPDASAPERSGSVRDVRSGAAPVAASPAARQCLSRLADRKARFSALPDAYFAQGCSAVGAVNLTALAADDGDVFVTNLGPVYCPLADDFAAWAQYGVDRAAQQMLGSRLMRIETFGSYSCRNVAGSSRRSAHASAQAIDVAAFVLADGRRITVQDGWQRGGAEKAFLRRIQDSACRRFGTVLGPDYNAAHRDHFHLEHDGGGFCR